MLEFLLCSSVTILPDFLYRRFAQGKRLGIEITLFSVWYELRWGITACLILTVSLITMIFYFHPSTTNATSFFRTVTILPEAGGRVAEVAVATGDRVAAGDLIFRLDDSQQQAAAETARRRIAEVDAELLLAQADLAAAEGAIDQAIGSLEQAEDELARQLNLQARNPDVVSGREIDRLQNLTEARQGALDAAVARRQAAEVRIEVQLPARRESAEAQLAEAQVALDKTRVVAGVAGTVRQFELQVGDFVSPVLRPAGILVPASFDEGTFVAGFGQIAAQVIHPGMITEVACASHPYRIIPMRVTMVQDAIAAGQFRPSDALLDVQDRVRDGTLTVRMAPLFEGHADAIPPGSRCIANAYTSNHERLQDEDLGTFSRIGLHTIDTVGAVHAILLRIQVFLLPVQTLVFSGGH